MNKLLNEINRNLQLMDVETRNIISEQKTTFLKNLVDDILPNIQNGIKDIQKMGVPTNQKVRLRDDGESITLNKLIDINNRLIDGTIKMDDLLTLNDIYPDFVTNFFVDEIGKDELKELIKVADIKTVDRLKEVLTQIGGDDIPKEHAGIISELIGKKTIDDINAEIAGKVGDDVTDAGRVGDDVDTPNPSRTVDKGEREIVPKNEIDPNDTNFTIDGRPIIYDAKGRPTAVKKIETVEPKEPKPIETPDSTDPELKIPDAPAPSKSLTKLADEMVTADELFRQKNKKLFEELSDNFKILDDNSLSVTKKAEARRNIKEISIKLSRRWNRTFLNFKGKKSFKEMIEWFEASKSIISKDDREIIDTVINSMQIGLPKKFFEDKSKWEILKNGLKLIQVILTSTWRGGRHTSTLGSEIWLYIRNIYRKSRGREKILSKISERQPDRTKWAKAVDNLEIFLGSPNMRLKVKTIFSSEDKISTKIVKLLSELVGGLLRVGVVGAMYLGIAKAIIGYFAYGNLRDTLNKWREEKENDPNFEPPREEVEKIVNDLSYVILTEFNAYSESDENIDVLYSTANGIVNTFDKNILLDVPIKRRAELVSMVVNKIITHTTIKTEGRAMDLLQENLKKLIEQYVDGDDTRMTELENADTVEEVPDWIKSIFSRAGADGELTKFDPQAIINLIQKELEGYGVTISDVLVEIQAKPELYNDIKDDLKQRYSGKDIDKLITDYISSDSDGYYVIFKEKNGTETRLNIEKKKIKLDGDSKYRYIFYEPGDDKKFKFSTIFNDYIDNLIKTNINESIIKKGLILLLLEQLPDSDDESGDSSTSSDDSSGSSDDSSDSSDDSSEEEISVYDRLRNMRTERIKSAGGNFTYLKDSSDKVRDDIKNKLRDARRDAGEKYKPAIVITLTDPDDYDSQKVVFAGTSEVDGSEVQYDVEKKDNTYGWIDNTGAESSRPIWKPFSEYKYETD